MKAIRVGVTGLNVADNPQPGLAVARCLLDAEPGARRVPIGFTYDLQWTAVHAREVFEAVHLVAPPWFDPAAFVHRLAAACRAERVVALLPTLDADVATIACHRLDLQRAGVRTFGPTPEMLARLWRLWRPGVLPRADVSIPGSAAAHTAADVTAIAATFGYPVVLRSLSGETTEVTTPLEAHVLGERFLRWWGAPLVVRPRLDGTDYQVAAVGYRGRVIAAVAAKVLTRGGNGSAWSVVTVGDNKFLAAAGAIIRKTGWTGPLLLEFVQEAWSKRIWLLGASGAFPIWVGAARAAGHNLPGLVLRGALTGRLAGGHRLPPYASGVMLALTSRDEISDISVLAELGTIGRVNGSRAAVLKEAAIG